MWSTQATEYYSAIKRSEVQIHMRTWMNLKSIMISERSQMLRGHILYDSVPIKCPEEANPQRQEVDYGLGEGHREYVLMGFLFGVMNRKSDSSNC